MDSGKSNNLLKTPGLVTGIIKIPNPGLSDSKAQLLMLLYPLLHEP